MPSPTDSQSGIRYSGHMHNITTMLFHKPLGTGSQYMAIIDFYLHYLSYPWSAIYIH